MYGFSFGVDKLEWDKFDVFKLVSRLTRNRFHALIQFDLQLLSRMSLITSNARVSKYDCIISVTKST